MNYVFFNITRNGVRHDMKNKLESIENIECYDVMNVEIMNNVTKRVPELLIEDDFCTCANMKTVD